MWRKYALSMPSLRTHSKGTWAKPCKGAGPPLTGQVPESITLTGSDLEFLKMTLFLMFTNRNSRCFFNYCYFSLFSSPVATIWMNGLV